MKTTATLIICFISLIFASCAKSVVPPATKAETYNTLYKESPHTVLIMLPINKTNNVEAKEFFYTTLSTTMVDQGYYVMPPFMSQEILRRESANDSERFIDASLQQFGQVFGVDAVLFTVIHKWEKNGLTDKVETQVEYILKSTKTNKVLFERKGDLIYDTTVRSSGGGLAGLAIAAVASKIKTATTNYVKVGRMCNRVTLADLPTGKYHPSHKVDSLSVSGLKDFSRTISN